MSPSKLIEVLPIFVASRVPVWIWGPPGVGKTDAVLSVGEKLGREVRTLIGVLLDPVDLRGIPQVVGKVTAWCPPDFLPQEDDPPGILFLDEIAQAPTSMQAAFMQLSLTGQLGGYKLPEHWSVVSASNRMEDRAGTNRIITPLLDRFFHLDFEVDHDDWQEWALRAGIHPKVRAFLRARPNLLHQFHPEDAQRSQPTPRGWEAVSRILDRIDPSLRLPVLSGRIGKGPAMEFMTFLNLEVPSPDEILADPDGIPIPTQKPDLIYAMTTSVALAAKSATAKKLKAIVKFATRLPRDFAVLLMRDSVAINKAILHHADNWLLQNRELLLGGGKS